MFAHLGGLGISYLFNYLNLGSYKININPLNRVNKANIRKVSHEKANREFQCFKQNGSKVQM